MNAKTYARLVAAQRHIRVADMAKRTAKRTKHPDHLTVARGLLAECRSMAISLNQGRLLARIDTFLEESD